MNRNTNFIMLFLSCVINTACGQSDRANQSANDVTKEQYNAISKEIKTFNYNPTYQVRFTAVNCTYEIYVNDMLANFSFTTGNSAGEQHVDIPQYILNSGPQEIKLKIYPRAIQDGKLEDKLRMDASFEARIVHGEYGKTDWENFARVADIKVPIDGGKMKMEYTKTFDAQVPYKLDGWGNGADLGKENKVDLTKEALAVSEQFAKSYRNKDIRRVASMIYNREKEVAQAFFFRSGEPKSYDNGWGKIEEEVAAIKKVEISNQYDLRYFANGKVVALLQRVGEDRNFPIIEAETDEDYVYYALYFFRPKPGAPLKIIR